jgi:hypothetical protein
MAQRNRTFVFLLGTLLLLWALACGGPAATPVAVGDVPVYVGAQPLEHGESFVVDAIVAGLTESAESMASEGASLETGLYTLPAGTTWADVKSFYEAEMAGTDLELESEFAEESDPFYSMGWARQSGDEEQALLVIYIADVFEDGAPLMVLMLVSESGV